MKETDGDACINIDIEAELRPHELTYQRLQHDAYYFHTPERNHILVYRFSICHDTFSDGSSYQSIFTQGCSSISDSAVLYTKPHFQACLYVVDRRCASHGLPKMLHGCRSGRRRNAHKIESQAPPCSGVMDWKQNMYGNSFQGNVPETSHASNRGRCQFPGHPETNKPP